MSNRNITFIEGDKIISMDDNVKTLEINAPTECLNDAQGIDDPIVAAIHKYTNHPSILKIIDRLMKFSFKEIEISDIELEIKILNAREGNTFSKFPTKLLKDNWEIYNITLYNIINNGIKEAMFDEV